MKERTKYHSNGRPSATVTYDDEGRYHSFNDKPAFTCWNSDGTVTLQTWCQHGRAVRESGPSHQEFDDNGRLEVVEYRVPGLREKQTEEERADPARRILNSFHRVGGPAFAKYWKDGTPFREEYWEQGRFLHGWVIEEVANEDTKEHYFRKRVLEKPASH